MQETPYVRPDLVDLIGPDWDRDTSAPAKQTLIICSAPRTGSYELCRFLAAAELGVPHEYFHPIFAEMLMTRWQLAEHPLSPEGLASYIAQLRRRRTAGGVFSIKLQYWQFKAFLKNQQGAHLFDGACVLHLFRPDIAAQLVSYRAARQSGIWDFSSRQTQEPAAADEESKFESVLDQIETLVESDAGFRRLFALLGIDPHFVPMRELFDDPTRVVQSLASRLGVTVNESALAKMVLASSPYSRSAASSDPAIARLSEQLKQYAFTQ